MEVVQQAISDLTILSYTQENILFTQSAAHEYLFPCVKYIVHHGGSGSIQAALQSGVLSIITPVFVDQFDHSYTINQLQIGVEFTQSLKKISSKEVTSAIHSVTNNNDDLIQQCKEIAAFVHNENGNEAIIKIVDHPLENDNTDFIKNKMNQNLMGPEIFDICSGVVIASIIVYLIVAIIK